MARDKEIMIQKHKMAYLAHKSGMRTEEIANRLGVANTTITSWRSNNMKCICPWHNWSVLITLDTPVNHRRAFALASTGHSFKDIGSGLGVPSELVEEWSIKSFPCTCGCHDWGLNANTEEAPSADLVDIKNESMTSIAPVPINTPVLDAQTTTLHVTMHALSVAVQKEAVVPRSWKDVLDTLKTVSEIIKDLAPKIPVVSPDKVAKFSRTETFEIPGDQQNSVGEEAINLATQLKKVATSGVIK